MGAFVFCLLTGSSALDSQWRDARDGDWRHVGTSKSVIRQGVPDVRADLLRHVADSEGSCYRTWVEMTPSAYRAGMWIGRSENPADWLLLVLDGQYEGRGFALLDSAGSVLWEDPWVEWVSYTPYLLEAVCEPGRVRVQLFGWEGPELLSQSDWLEIPAHDSSQRYFGFHTDRAIARFQGWEIAAEPMSPIVPDAPNRLRLVNDAGSEWRVVGHGKWMWSSPERTTLKQSADIERTTAVYLGHPQTEGIWRTQVRVHPRAGGAGLLYRTDESAEQGFSAWLGGTPGAGALMLYTLSPVEALWTSEQNIWHYDTSYVLEARVGNGQTRARLLAEDGATVIAESPPFPVPADTPGAAALAALQTWKGTARFGPIQISEQSLSDATMPSAELPALEGWKVLSGAWSESGEGGDAGLRADGGDSPARIVNESIQGAKGVWTSSVVPETGASEFGLLFQVDPDLKRGFLLRIADSEVSLNTLEGRTLWQQAFEGIEPGHALILEGIVATDRIRIRVSQVDGTVLVESSDCYVSDTNNDRIGGMGFVCTGGARFSGWSFDERD
ncbi:MAG: hypothetical protein AMXMBFR82_47950 [Candidatus Hydrogenedentota bacterium]